MVGTGGLFGQDVVVPANFIVPPEIAENTSYQEEVVVLNLTKAELEGMPVFDHSRYSSPPAGWGSPSAHGYPAGNYLWSGLSKSYPVEPDPVIQSESRDPEELREAAIGKGAVVLDRNGNDIGVVEDLRFRHERQRPCCRCGTHRWANPDLLWCRRNHRGAQGDDRERHTGGGAPSGQQRGVEAPGENGLIGLPGAVPRKGVAHGVV